MMNRFLCFGVLVLLAAGGFAAGWAVRGVRGEAAPSATRLSADLKAVDTTPDPDLEGWRYPEARNGASGGVVSSRERLNFVHVEYQLGKYQVQTTPDDFRKVVSFYEKKCADWLHEAGLKEKEERGAAEGKRDGPLVGSGVTGAVRNEKSGGSILAHDSLVPGTPDTPRKVQTCLLGVRSNNYVVTIFISRAEGDANTHVVLTQDRWSIRPLADGR